MEINTVNRVKKQMKKKKGKMLMLLYRQRLNL